MVPLASDDAVHFFIRCVRARTCKPASSDEYRPPACDSSFIVSKRPIFEHDRALIRSETPKAFQIVTKVPAGAEKLTAGAGPGAKNSLISQIRDYAH
ncbi:hypothetical protein [Caballeronia sp. HLA56]